MAQVRLRTIFMRSCKIWLAYLVQQKVHLPLVMCILILETIHGVLLTLTQQQHQFRQLLAGQ
jgi:hypothetical protein